MIDIFEPLNFKISQPIPEEISIICDSSIEKYLVNKVLCSQYVRSAEGFFRFKSGSPSTEHIEYLNKKTSEIYKIAREIDPNSTIIRVDYFLDSGLMIGVYIREDLGEMIGCIRGFRADKMTEEEFKKLWHGSSNE